MREISKSFCNKLHFSVPNGFAPRFRSVIKTQIFHLLGSIFWRLVRSFFFFNFWVYVLRFDFVLLLFLFKTALDLNSYDF